MYAQLTILLDRLDNNSAVGSGIIPWSCPVPSFGDISSSRVATLGINPSNREFVDRCGEELQGTFRRFPTLDSLGLESWSEADSRHIDLILENCRSYFHGNPYNTWFKKLDTVIGGANASYYDSDSDACHLDLVPYATEYKWTELSKQQRELLLQLSNDALALTLRDSSVQLLILNGSSVVRCFQAISGVALQAKGIPSWSLKRNVGPNVPGIAYTGDFDSLSEITLGREVTVLGFNHNLQSSYGVSGKIICAIKDWIAFIFKSRNVKTR